MRNSVLVLSLCFFASQLMAQDEEATEVSLGSRRKR